MPEPKISLTMRTGAKHEKGEIDPSVGGEVKVEFDPAEVAFSIDYSKEDRLVGKLEGEVNLRLVGLPESLKLSGGTEISVEKWSVAGGLEWEINSKISAKIEYEHGKASQEGKASITLRW